MKTGTIYEVQIPIAAPQKLSWQDGAVCTQVGLLPFFPPKGGQYREARKLCGGCDVRLKCKAWILEVESGDDRHDRHGMFAGMSPEERFLADPIATAKYAVPNAA